MFTRSEILKQMIQSRIESTSYLTCFVGRCLSNREEVDKYSKISGNQLVARTWTTLKFLPEYSGYESRFWTMIQNFHDWSYLWRYNKDRILPKYLSLPPGTTPPEYILTEAGYRYYCRVLDNLEQQQKQEAKNFSRSLASTVKSISKGKK